MEIVRTMEFENHNYTAHELVDEYGSEVYKVFRNLPGGELRVSCGL